MGTMRQDPAAFGIGRLFWLTSDAIVGAELTMGTIVLWNPAAVALFGYSDTEAIGMPLERLVPDELHDRHLSGISAYRAGAPPALVGGPPVDVPAVTKSGAIVDVALTLTDLGGDDPHRHHVLALIRDMTAVRTSEREVSHAMDAMREFVATASHDLRTPLTSVMGFSRMMLELGDRLPPDKGREVLEAISRGATQASRLVDDLLTLSQIQAEVLPTNPKDLSLLVAVREAIVRSAVEAQDHVADDVVVRADPNHLERILINFLTNAMRYGAPPIVVDAHVQDGVVDIAVRDRGPGVPDAFRPRLFTRFARADTSRADGTGLGLSIVQGLARANGGDTYYEATSEGPTFGVRLPAGSASQ